MLLRCRYVISSVARRQTKGFATSLRWGGVHTPVSLAGQRVHHGRSFPYRQVLNWGRAEFCCGLGSSRYGERHMLQAAPPGGLDCPPLWLRAVSCVVVAGNSH